MRKVVISQHHSSTAFSPSRYAVPDHPGITLTSERNVSPATSEKNSNWQKVKIAGLAVKFSSRLLDRVNGLHRKAKRLRPVIHMVRALQRLIAVFPPGFRIGPDHIHRLIQRRNVALQERGGAEGLSKLLNSDVTRGIEDDPAAIEYRRIAFGRNDVPPDPGESFWTFVWDACHEPSLIILLVCAVVSFASDMFFDGPNKGWYDGCSLGVAITVVIFVVAGCEYKISMHVRMLSQEQKDVQVEVTRSGRRCPIPLSDIVVGDIVLIRNGDRVPADGVLVFGQSLVLHIIQQGFSIHPSGESGQNRIRTSAQPPFLLSGSNVVEGYGTMLVIRVGEKVSSDNLDLKGTPLQCDLNKVAEIISHGSLIVAVWVFIILLIMFFAEGLKKDKSPSIITQWALNRFVDIVEIGVTIFVAFVPEGLRLAVSLRFACTMKEMMHEKSMRLKLAASEAMGSVTTICCGKSGILTLNQMDVKKAWVANKFADRNDFQASQFEKEVFETLLVGLCQNSSGSVIVPGADGEAEVLGSPTETAALLWGHDIGMDSDVIKRTTAILHFEAFNSRTKRSRVVVQRSGNKIVAHWKGDAEMIFGMSRQWVDEGGTVHSMTPNKAGELTKLIRDMAEEGLRCIAFAYQALDPTDVPDVEENRGTWDIPDEDLTFICVIGMEDSCRSGMKANIKTCKAAGIKILMVTGDSVPSAKTVAKDCGILTEHGQVVQGSTFRNWDEDDLDQNLSRLEVLAEALPTDKAHLVKALKKRNEVVAVTVDGTNDLPALEEADVRFLVGKRETAVVMNSTSSDLVIIDDPFPFMVKAIQWGRSVFATIQKLIQFQITVNAAVFVINLVAAVAHGSSPLTPVQLLWLNFIINRLGTLALATEAPNDDLMEKGPVQKSKLLTNVVMWGNVFTQALYQIAVLMAIVVWGKKIFKLEGKPGAGVLHGTILFNVVVLCQIFNKVNCRRLGEKNIFGSLHRSYLFLGIIIIEVMLQVLFVQFFGKFTDSRALTWRQWLRCMAIGFGAWPMALFSKFCPVGGRSYPTAQHTRRPRFLSFLDGSRFGFSTRTEGEVELLPLNEPYSPV